MKIKIYVVTECYTSNDRGAEGYISETEVFTSYDKAIEKMREWVNAVDREAKIDEKILFPSKEKYANASATDYEFASYNWKLIEREIDYDG
jgi:hypothetical protein